MREKTLIIILTLLILSVVSINDTDAEIYKHIDKDGRITYSNKLIKGANKLQIDPPAFKIEVDTTISSKDFSNVNERTQKDRDIKRRQILENELAIEKKLLADVKQSLLTIQKNSPTPETTLFRFQSNIIKYKEELERELLRHTRNIAALKKELAKL